jgi:hypothetical protein
MRRRRRDDVVRSRRSIFFYTDYLSAEDKAQRPERYWAELYPHMLFEDVRWGVAPISGRSDSGEFRVSLVPEDQRAQDLIEAGMAREGYSHDLADSVCDFLQECASLVVAYGEATYEVAYLSEREGSEPEGFELVLIPAGTVREQRGRLVQHLPTAFAREHGLSPEIELVRDDVLLVSPPKPLGRQLRRMLASLSFLSTNIMPEWVFQFAPMDPKRPPFEEGLHVTSRKLALAEATREIGWDARGLFGDELLEYYQLLRLLRFERFKAELRELILSGVNDCLMRVGRRLDFRGRIEMEGLPTLDEIESAEEALRSGSRPFTDIVKQFRRV